MGLCRGGPGHGRCRCGSTRAPATILPAQALVTLLVGLNANVAVPYSDLPAAACVSLASWAAVLAWTRGGPSTGSLPAWRRWARWVPVLLLLTVAVTLKPYAVSLVIGMAGAGLGWAARRHRWRPVPAVLAGLALLVLVVSGLHTVAERSVGLSREALAAVEAPFPPAHFLAMGTFDTREDGPTRRYGAYSQAQVDETASIRDPDRRREMLRERVTGQVRERGVWSNVAFTVAKISWVWGDGTFWTHGDGTDSQQPGVLDGRSHEAQQWFIGDGQAYRAWTAPITQGAWIAVLIVTAVGVWRARRSPAVTAGALTLLALTAYIAVFEARPRYLATVLPVVLMLTVLTADG